VADPIEIQRRIRRRLDANGLSADVAADINIAVSTSGADAVARQCAPIRQGRPHRAGRKAADAKEQP
jgi:hypothetical protein